MNLRLIERLRPNRPGTGLALNSATSAESVPFRPGCGSSIFNLATVSLLFQVLMNSQARSLFLEALVIIQMVPGPPTVNDGPAVSVRNSTYPMFCFVAAASRYQPSRRRPTRPRTRAPARRCLLFRAWQSTVSATSAPRQEPVWPAYTPADSRRTPFAAPGYRRSTCHSCPASHRQGPQGQARSRDWQCQYPWPCPA